MDILSLFLLARLSDSGAVQPAFVQRSWRFYEGSANYGGMPGLFVLKSFILLFAAVVGLQALAMLLRGILVLRNQEQLLPESLRYQEAQ